MTEPLLLWLSPPAAAGAGRPSLGGKAANLATLAAADFPVPPAFCLTTAAYRAFLAHSGRAPDDPPADLCRAFRAGPFPPHLERVLLQARTELLALGGEAGAPLLAVRSSATVEDLESASFAGQAHTALGVQGDTELLAAVRECWASLWSARAQSYHSLTGDSLPEMAVIVQQMIPCQVSGIATSVDPLDGAPEVVIEATTGLGDKLAAGGVVGEHLRVAPGSAAERPDGAPAAESRLLTAGQAEQIAELAREAEACLGAPQEVEWGFLGEDLFLFQSRPLTVRPSGFFSQRLPADNHLWTGGFFNERLSRPVSPLGWTLLRELVVPLALLDPLRFLGVSPSAIPPAVKLYRGHPYANVALFQMLYAAFPDWMLPADAYRYFPGGDISLRRQVPYPRSLLHPRTFFSLAMAFLRQPAAVSPWHNWRAWESFERRHGRVLARLEAGYERVSRSADPRPGLWDLFQRAQALNRQLLRLHRWSLTMAELTYTLLRRLLQAWAPVEDADGAAARLVAGLPSYSLQLNAALHQLAAGQISLDEFLLSFGHRGFDLDIAHPTFADQPGQVTELAARLAAGDAARPDRQARVADRRELQRRVEARLRPWQRPVFREVLRLARAYMLLRENQRFVWQKALAFQRRLLVTMGQSWAAEGALERPEEIFAATLEEVGSAATGRAPLPREDMAARSAELARLEREHGLAPELTYPPFLRGDRPLVVAAAPGESHFQGLPVSPGVGSGPARIVLSPEQFERVRPGDVLVTRGADPGWTPHFGLLAGLILETGGQLSHGAVVAREYGLPAVAAVPGITRRLADGQRVTLDGRTGIVSVDRDQDQS